jgi:peptidoglycan/xylan/chitin deacetylase (PgdA/CDA1 family)
VVRGARGKQRIALTFDAGGVEDTLPQLLATLRERGIRVTIFITGKFAERYPESVRQAAADGHEIANHTYSHRDSRELTDEQLIEELARTEAILQELTGRTSKPFWRPPYGARNNHVLNVAAAQGYRSIYWTLDSLDSVGQPKTPEFLFDRVTNPPAGVELDGAVTLHHVGFQSTADALPRILDRLQEMGLQVVTVSDLLSP